MINAKEWDINFKAVIIGLYRNGATLSEMAGALLTPGDIIKKIIIEYFSKDREI